MDSGTPAPAGPGVVTRNPATATTATSASVVDATASFDGHFEAAQDFVVMGTVSGEIVCKGVLTIEQNATAKARIEAREATIRGRVDGDVVCSGRLLIASTAHVTGTIKAGALVVEDGASIRGNIETASAATGEGELPAPRAPRKAERADEASAAAGGSGRWTRSRDVPTFALVSSDDRNNAENG
jgi:cytoskeletal protein CcmA (bactofilin family)